MLRNRRQLLNSDSPNDDSSLKRSSVARRLRTRQSSQVCFFSSGLERVFLCLIASSKGNNNFTLTLSELQLDPIEVLLLHSTRKPSKYERNDQATSGCFSFNLLTSFLTRHATVECSFSRIVYMA